jgi:hypothetical protein
LEGGRSDAFDSFSPKNGITSFCYLPPSTTYAFPLCFADKMGQNEVTVIPEALHIIFDHGPRTSLAGFLVFLYFDKIYDYTEWIKDLF